MTPFILVDVINNLALTALSYWVTGWWCQPVRPRGGTPPVSIQIELTRVSTHRQMSSMKEPCEPIHRWNITRLRPRIKPPSKAPGHSLGQSWHAAARSLVRLTCDRLVTYDGNSVRAQDDRIFKALADPTRRSSWTHCSSRTARR